MPTMPSIIAYHRHHQQHSNNNHNNYGNNNNNSIQNGLNANITNENGKNENWAASISSRPAAISKASFSSYFCIRGRSFYFSCLVNFLFSDPILSSNPCCCCGLVQIRHVAIVLGVLEFVIFFTQLIVSFVHLFGNADDFGPRSVSTLSILLTIISLILAIAAAMLLVSGVKFRSPYLLVPHIWMQYAFMIASLVLIGYLFSLWFGGFKIRICAIVFEDSEKGYQGVHTAKNRSSIRSNFEVDEFSTIVLLIIIFCGIVFVIQLWLYYLIISLFREMLKQPKAVASSLSPTHSDAGIRALP